MTFEHDIHALRGFLKDDVRMRTDFSLTDQNNGVPMPPVQKPLPDGAKAVPLPQWRGKVQVEGCLDTLIAARRSLRKYKDAFLTAEEISFLLWATQGVRDSAPGRVLRTVPSAGNRHSCETYLIFTCPVRNGEGDTIFEQGVWRYLPLQHALTFVHCPDNLSGALIHAALDQVFVGRAPVTFLWTSLPYRTEWRYAQASHKVIALDAGHICQNLYLACGAIGCGTCAVAAYRQQAADALVAADGRDEFVIYMAPVGKDPSISSR